MKIKKQNFFQAFNPELDEFSPKDKEAQYLSTIKIAGIFSGVLRIK